MTVLEAGRDHARAVDQRHRQPRLRLSGLGGGQRLHLGGEQPREPADAVVERSGRAIRRAKRSTCATRRRGELWSPTAQPIRDDGTYIARHGFGYSRFEHEANGIALELLQYVPLADPIKISRLTLRNLSGRSRAPVGHGLCGVGARHLARRLRRPSSRRRSTPRAARCWRAIPGASRFAAASPLPTSAGKQTGWTADRTEFLGRNGGSASPEALAGTAPLSGANGRRPRSLRGPADA